MKRAAPPKAAKKGKEGEGGGPTPGGKADNLTLA